MVCFQEFEDALAQGLVALNRARWVAEREGFRPELASVLERMVIDLCSIGGW